MRRPDLTHWLRAVFLATVLVFGGLFVAHRWSRVSDALERLSFPPVGGAFVLAVAGILATMQSWRVLLAYYGHPLPFGVAARVFFVGQLGKYIPGSVWSVVAQAELGRDYHVPRPASVTVSIVSVAQSVFAGVFLGVVLLPVDIPELAGQYWWVALVIPIYLAVLQPPVVHAVTRRAFRLARQQPPTVLPGYRGMWVALGWTAVSWLLLGLHAWMLVVGFGAYPWHVLGASVGGFALAFSVGLVFVPVPAGAGVREAVFTALLGGLVGSGVAIAVALISRVMLAIVDFGLAGGQAILHSRIERRAVAAVRRHE